MIVVVGESLVDVVEEAGSTRETVGGSPLNVATGLARCKMSEVEEQLLREGNELRRRAVSLQEESMALQRSLVDEQRANLARASQINDQAMQVQRRARSIQALAVPALLALVAYASYLLFFRLGL